MKRSRKALALALLVAGAASLVGARAADGGSTSRLTILYIREDAFRNYDFLSQTVSSTNVDWPIGLVFWNDANVNRVKNALSLWYPWPGSRMNGRLNDGAGFVWDQDGGMKSILCPVWGDSYHYRVYADGNDRMYNAAWGYWIFGSAHIDHNECGFGKWHGRSEQAEGHVAARARSWWGSGAVLEDYMWFSNPEPYREQGNHIWSNNGYATFVRVP